jgi:protein TonB
MTHRLTHQFIHHFIHPFTHFLKLVFWGSFTCVMALWLTGCTTTELKPTPPAPAPVAPAPPAPPPVKPPEPVVQVEEPAKPKLPVSNARNPREYRVDAAKHLYQLNGSRIFKGRMPPMLYAVGVLDVEVDKQGQVTRTQWIRAPGHAPEVMREIEKTVRQAAPYPVPAHFSTRHPDRRARLKWFRQTPWHFRRSSISFQA